MGEVRKHRRLTASGKTTTVRHHQRNTGSSASGGQQDEAEQARAAWAERAAPHVSSFAPAESAVQDEDWWDGDDGAPAGDFWAEPEPDPEPEMSDAFRSLMAQNPSLGDGFDRLSMLRNAGYDGPVDQDGNPTSRKGLFRARMKAAKERDEAQERFCYAPTIAERDAAQRDYKAAQDKLDLLPGALDRRLDG
jgi:hypothetical protein